MSINGNQALIDGEQLIQQQLEATEVTEVIFADGRRTVLHPVAYVPALDDSAARLSLDGEWRVTRWPFALDEAQLAAPGIGDSDWQVVAQPGKVFSQDAETCAASIKGWDRVGLTHIDAEDGAMLRRTVRIPESWAGKRIYLTFDGIYPGGRVYLNGTLLGEHTSGLTPVEWDVTDNIHAGETAVVAVRLLRRHPFVKMDMPRHAAEFAGLAQPAYFHATEPCHLSEVRLNASLDVTYQDGLLEGMVTVGNQGTLADEGVLTVTVHDAGGRYAAGSTNVFLVNDGASEDVPVALEIPAALHWNDEYPYLYTVTVTLTFPGQPEQTISYRTGFRRFELKDERPLLNGAPVKFRGVNHLTYHP